MCDTDFGYEQGMLFEENYAWVLLKRNGLARINFLTGEMTVEKVFERFSSYELDLFCSIGKVKDSLVLIPGASDCIGIFNTKSKAVDYIPCILKSKYCLKNSIAPLWKSTTIENNIYIYGYTYPGIIKLDVDNRRVDKIDDWITEAIVRNNGQFPERYCLDGGQRIGESIFVPLSDVPAILEIATDDDRTKLHYIDDSIEGFDGCSVVKNQLYLLARSKEGLFIVIWSKGKRVKKILKLDNFTENKAQLYWSPIVYDNSLFIFPAAANAAYRFSIDSGKLDTIADEGVFESTKYEPYSSRAWTIGEDNGTIMFQVEKSRKWFMYNCKRNSVDEIPIKTDYSLWLKRNIEEKILTNISQNGYVNEKQFSLKDYIGALR